MPKHDVNFDVRDGSQVAAEQLVDEGAVHLVCPFGGRLMLEFHRVTRCPTWLVSTGGGRRRGGGALIGLYLSFLWESSFLFLVFSMVFSLAWWRYFLGFCYGESTG